MHPPLPGATLIKPAPHALGACVWRVPTPNGPQVWKDCRHLSGTWRAPIIRYLLRRERRALTALARDLGPVVCEHPSPLVLAMEKLLCRPLADGDGALLLELMPRLEQLHTTGWTHNDIHRSNVCIVGNAARLLDFGAAQRWPRWLLAPFATRDRAHLLVLAARYGAPVAPPARSRLSQTLQASWRQLRKLELSSRRPAPSVQS